MSKKMVNGKLVDQTPKDISQAAKDAEDAKIPQFKTLSRPAFLFMSTKIGFNEDAILGLIASMPDGTEAEQDAKLLAEVVFKNQQEFHRDNALLASIVAKTSLTDEQVDAAWQQGEQISW